MIHGLDITVPADLSRRVPAERLTLVLDGLTQGKTLKHFGLRIDGVQLRATDMDWSFGSGAGCRWSAGFGGGSPRHSGGARLGRQLGDQVPQLRGGGIGRAGSERHRTDRPVDRRPAQPHGS